MAQSKEFFTRIQHKHDIEANWIKAVNFVPLNGEIIVYDKDDEHDYARIKIGDGITKINELRFILPTSEDAVELAMELGLINPVAAEDGSVYTDENGVMYSL